jgi:hypothetical protein
MIAVIIGKVISFMLIFPLFLRAWYGNSSELYTILALGAGIAPSLSVLQGVPAPDGGLSGTGDVFQLGKDDH